MKKKTKIANKEEDSFVSGNQYGFKGNKKNKYGYDLSEDDYKDANVLELENDDPREVLLLDDEKEKNKKHKSTNNQSHQENKVPPVVTPEVDDSANQNTNDEGKEDGNKQIKNEELKTSVNDLENPTPEMQKHLEEEEKENLKVKDKEKEKQENKEKNDNEDQKKDSQTVHKEEKGKITGHGGGLNSNKNNSNVSNPLKGNPKEKKDVKDENAGTVEKISINKESTDGYASSLNEVHPIQFIDEVKNSPTTAHKLEDKESKKEEAKLPKLEQPTGLPLKGSEKIDKTKNPTNTKDINLQPEGLKKIKSVVEEKHVQNDTPFQLPKIPFINKEQGDANQIKNAVHSFPTQDPNLNSDFGPVPEINLEGQADPQQNKKFHTEALDQTNEEKSKADLEVKKDFGENNVYPDIPTEILKTDYQFNQPHDIASIVNQDTSAFDEATKAKFDENALNKLQQDRDKEIQKVLDGKDKKDQKIEKEHKLHHEKIDKETLKAKKDQEKEQDVAKKSVDKHRQDWDTENQKVKSDFDNESDKKKKETKASIDDQVKKTDDDIKSQVSDANKQVKEQTDAAEQKAKAEKAKADDQPKGFWDSITDAVSDFFDAIKDAINSIFDALRKFVKTVIEKAKKAINSLIDFVRDAVIGMIKAFGEALKALVKVALAAFPELRDKFCAFIDKAVDTACAAVNAIAEGLKKAVNFLLDALGKVIDMVLAFYQSLINLALSALQMLAVGLLKVLKFLSQIGEKLKKFGALIDAINDIYHHPEILEQAAQQTIQPYIDKIPAETAAKLNEGLSAVGLSKHFKGVWKYLGPALSHLASNWWGEAKKMVWFLIWPFAEGSPLYEDAPKLVHLIPQIWKDVRGGDYSKAIDGCLEWMQALNMTLGAFSGWMAIAGIVVGAVIGGVVGAVGGAGVGAIPGAMAGAGAGLELAAAVGEGLMVSMMATEAAVLTKAIYDLMTTEDDEEKESTPATPATPPNENNNSSANKPEGPQGGSEQPTKHLTSGTIKSGHDRIEYSYQRIANSVITLGIMGALFLLGAIGGKIAQGLASAIKKIAAALDRVAPETMAGIRNVMSKVSSGAGKFTKPFKDFGEKHGGDFNKGRKWMEGKIDNVKGKFGIKKKGKGGKEEENNNNNNNEEKDNQNNNENNNENNQNNKDENQNQNNNENNEQNQNNSEKKDEVDTNSKEENNSTKNEEEGNTDTPNSEEKNEVDTKGENENATDTKNEKVDEKPVEEKPVEEKATEENEQSGKENEETTNKDEQNPLDEKEPKSEAKDNTPDPKEKPAVEKTPEELLDEALKRQGFKDGEAYPNGFKEKWSDGEYDYEVRIHEGEPQHGKTENIYRVGRRKKGVDAKGQGFGWEYGDMDGNWHSTKSLKPGKGSQKNPDYNEQAAKDTHIEVPDKKIGETKNGPKEEIKNTENTGPKNEDPVNSESTPPKETPKEEGIINSDNKSSSESTDTNVTENNNGTDTSKTNVKGTDGKKNKMETGANKGEAATPETIRQGTVKMEEHPDYSKLIEHAEEKGFRVEFTEGDPHVSVKEVVKLDGTVEVDKVLYLQKEMRFIDLEHEIGHIDQLGRFKETPFTEKLVEYQDKTTGETKLKTNPDQSGILNNWKDAITEYHNRLAEYLRLKERGVDPVILKQHEAGLQSAFEKYRSKGLKEGRSKSQKAWADENFPDIKELEAKYNQSKEVPATKEISTGNKESEIVDPSPNPIKEESKQNAHEEKPIEDKSGQKYLKLAEQAYEIYSKELPEALSTLDELVGEYGEISGRAKRPESAANRLERANKNFNKKIETVTDAVDNTWDALGTRIILKDASAESIDAMVNDLCEGIKSGKLKVTKVNSLTGKNGNPYLTEAHLQQIKAAGDSINQLIDVASKEYDTGYTIGAIYVEYPSGVRGEIQIIGKDVLQVANAEHLPYDGILNKPYLDTFKPEFQSEAQSLIDPIRNAAQSLDEGQKAAYYSYLNDCYKNARGMESGGPASKVPLPEGLPPELSLDNLLHVEDATKKFKK